MAINFSNLERFSLQPREASFFETKEFEKEDRQTLFGAMQPLGLHDSFNTSFHNCCIYTSRFAPISAGMEFCQEVYTFEKTRTQYLKSVVAYARDQFPGDEHAEKKLFELSLKKIRSIDPAIIGESRYEEGDLFVVKLFKVAARFFVGHAYFLLNRDEIRTWAARHDILQWGATEDSRTEFLPKLHHFGFETSGKGFHPRSPRDKIIKELYLDQLGHDEDDIEALQALFDIIPGTVEKFIFHPSTLEFRVVLEKEWVGAPNVEKLKEQIGSFDIEKEKERVSFPELERLKKEGGSADIEKVKRMLAFLKKDKLEKLLNIITGEVDPLANSPFEGQILFKPQEGRLHFGKVIEGKILKEEGMPPRLSFNEGSFQVEIPAKFGLGSPTIYMKLQEWGRKENGELQMKFGAGASFGYDAAIKTLAAAVTKAKFGTASTSVVLPRKDEEGKKLPSKKDFEIAKELINWV